MSQYIYIIGRACPLGSIPSGPFKIGRSACPKQRLAELQVGNHLPLKVLYTAETANPVRDEAVVQVELACCSIAGEWYDCDLEQAVTALISVGLAPITDGFTPTHGARMPAVSFNRWLSEMNAAPFYADEANCARLLGMTLNDLKAARVEGAAASVALACRALLHRLEPYA
jgi:hypothetical protein